MHVQHVLHDPEGDRERLRRQLRGFHAPHTGGVRWEFCRFLRLTYIHSDEAELLGTGYHVEVQATS